ncbi:MAG: endonuclease V [Planctomycetes bacterium RIFCSPHIGHO2_02_FULL_50_42]|nr:MAG: endonuclease V [Planctomycetes bacterium GWA2_50_13]OHB89679.1 MAG: endonuclease V [Planctomycetes bacterium RIFCSPHIGHO2_02_FULL_50_42]OHB91574.1 MAG: endonuclease V [Planctomycetes bacterium RIFCSPHIGHO2_12_FULL_51_37]OHB96196.1 MAG: endonuclease V [Planctomycetes bacterium RIFCSPLOWO2_02_FULL_50_16]
MRYKELHPWDVSYKEAVSLQEELRGRIIIKSLSVRPGVVAGADVSYSGHTNSVYAGIVVMDFGSMSVIEEATATAEVAFPYIPGLLSFREAPALLKAFSRIKKAPDVILFDGQGIAHPRGLGLASHMGLILDRPSIGCAKKLLLGEHKPVGDRAGAFSYILYKEKRIGMALRTREGVKPVFVSPGHKTDIISSRRVVLDCCRKYRLPEPIRKAHNLVTLLRMHAGEDVKAAGCANRSTVDTLGVP